MIGSRRLYYFLAENKDDQSKMIGSRRIKGGLNRQGNSNCKDTTFLTLGLHLIRHKPPQSNRMLSTDFVDITADCDKDENDFREEMQSTSQHQPSFIAKCSLWFHSQFTNIKDILLPGHQDSRRNSLSHDNVDASAVDSGLDLTTLPENNLVMKRLLGKGTFSRVMLCEELRSHRESAIKLISMAELVGNPVLGASVVKEIKMMKRIRHPHIVSFEKLIRTNDCVGIVMEYCPGGDLFSLVSQEGKLNESLVKDITRQLVSAVKYLHSLGIAHRDIKLENILLKSDGGSSLKIKLADLGLACSFVVQEKKQIDSDQVENVQMLRTRCGSEEYAAPEILRGIPYDGRLTDTWSIGIVIYACLFGTLPFALDNETGGGKKQLYNKICNGIFKIPMETPISEDCQRVLYALLRVIPEDRMTLSELERHPWLSHGR